MGRQAYYGHIFQYSYFSTYIRILFICLYYFINSFNVSQFSTHPIKPVFRVNGMIEYLVIVRSFLKVYLSLTNNLLTKFKNCITLSSSLKSYLPFNKKLYSLPLSPQMVSFLGRCFDCNTANSLPKPFILMFSLPG